MSLKKKTSRSIAIALVGVSMITPLFNTVSAMESKENEKQVQSVDNIKEQEKISNEINQELSNTIIDLNSYETKKVEKKLSNGETFSLEIAPENKENQLARVSNGVWNIKWNIGVCSCSFKIKVSNNKILSAYDGKYMFVPFSVKSANLKRDSSKQATYYFQFGTPIWDFGGWNGWLRANINSRNELKVSIK